MTWCVRLLLDASSPLGCRDQSMSSELHHACRLGLVSEVEELLVSGAEINAVNLTGNTPLHLCATTNQVRLVFLSLWTNIPSRINQTNGDLREKERDEGLELNVTWEEKNDLLC